MGNSNGSAGSEPLDEVRAKKLLAALVGEGLLTWAGIAEAVLASLQPPQTATHVCSLPGLRAEYAPRKRWAPARDWLFSHFSACRNCGKLAQLTHDHVLRRELIGVSADRLENLRFLCRRCNQSRHWAKGGLLRMGTAALSVHLLLTERPRTLHELSLLGRSEGLTQSKQRFEETWALALWLSKRGKYVVEPPSDEVGARIARLGKYYSDTNRYLEKLDVQLRKKWKELLAVRDNLHTLVTSRQKAKRVAAADALQARFPGIVKLARGRAGTAQILAAAGIAKDDILEVTRLRGPVALIHLLAQKDRDSIMQEIDETLAALRKKHGLSDPVSSDAPRQ